MWDILLGAVKKTPPEARLKRKQKKREVKPGWTHFLEVAAQLTDSTHLLPGVSVAVKNNPRRYKMLEVSWKGYSELQFKGRVTARDISDPRVFVFYMSLLAKCRWVQVVGLALLATQRSSPPRSTLTMGPHRLKPTAKPSSCRFGFRCAILVFGRCAFREQVMSHCGCSLAWTRGNPGNSGCRSKTVAGRLARLWWVHSSRVVSVCLFVLRSTLENTYKESVFFILNTTHT